MKNKRIDVTKTSGRNNLPKQQNEKAELGFEQLVSDAGCSKKTADELLKWYTNSH